MTDTINTVQLDDGRRIKGVATGDVMTHIEEYFEEYLQDGDAIVSWECESSSLVRYYGVKCHGEVQDYPQARVTDTLEEA